MKIFAMGGGENGWNGSIYNMEMFDKEIIKLSGKSHPVLLFIGFAAMVEEVYFEVIDYNFRRLGCNCGHLTRDDCKMGLAEMKIKAADIIYVGGGNTNRLMRALKKYHIDTLLSSGYCKNKVLCGVSAGAICWCSFGNAVKRDRMAQKTTYRAHGIGLVNIMYCPHIIRDPFRKRGLEKMLYRTKGVNGIALDNAALEIINGKYRILFLDNEESIAFKVVADKTEVVWIKLSDMYFHDIHELIN